MTDVNREIRLVSRPQGFPRPEDFELAETPVPEPAEGEILVRNAFMSVDPYMRGRMNDVKSYVPPFQIGEALQGGVVGEVVASHADGIAVGDWVSHMLGWREWAVVEARGAQPIDVAAAPPEAYLGVLGITGLTAYVGLFDIGRLADGETVFVSGAAGAVGSIAGQIAKAKGCTVIGSAGSPEKVAWLREIGFDHAFDYKTADLRTELAEAAPRGIELYFDNVGGDQLQAALGALRPHGRVVACGMISRYNDEQPTPGPTNLPLVVGKRLRLQGFIVSDHMDRRPAFLAELGGWLRDGTVVSRETVADGIENAPGAFIGLLRGENLGKMLVRIEPAPNS